MYVEMVGEFFVIDYKFLVFLVGFVFVEFVVDIVLCFFEVIKV